MHLKHRAHVAYGMPHLYSDPNLNILIKIVIISVLISWNSTKVIFVKVCLDLRHCTILVLLQYCYDDDIKIISMR